MLGPPFPSTISAICRKACGFSSHDSCPLHYCLNRHSLCGHGCSSKSFQVSLSTNGRTDSGTCPVVTSSEIVSPVMVLSKMPNPPCPLAIMAFSQDGIGPRSGRECGVFGRRPAHIRSMGQCASVGMIWAAMVHKCKAPSTETEVSYPTSALVAHTTRVPFGFGAR
jgi:hypothetical protein